MSVTPIHARRQPIGIYHAESCHDPSSTERGGQPYFACNELSSSTGERVAEVMFADGMWLLADPSRDLIPGFTLDALPDRVFLALSYGEPWNGFATPVVGRAVLAELLLALDVPHRWTGETVHVRDEEGDELVIILGPDGAGGYDTAPLGWMLDRLDV